MSDGNSPQGRNERGPAENKPVKGLQKGQQKVNFLRKKAAGGFIFPAAF